jgi:hypothetical protein
VARKERCKRGVLEYESCNQVVTITELESNSVMS